MKKTVLVVEAVPASSFLLRYVLEGDEFDVECVARGDEAIVSIYKKPPEIVIINWVMPGISGVELCRRLRACKRTCNSPIILLCNLTEEIERIRRLNLCDDVFDTKFFCAEHIKRCVKLLTCKFSGSEEILLGRGILNIRTKCIEYEKKNYKLSPINFRLINLFIRNPKKILTPERLFAEIWEPHFKSKYNRRTVNVQIARLRHMLSSSISENPIRTVRGSGYYFEETDTD